MTQKTWRTPEEQRKSTYNSYRAMFQRVFWGRRSGVGVYSRIAVALRWATKQGHGQGFKNFQEDLGDKPLPGMSIERRDNNLGYTPENCYWATPKEQANNRKAPEIVEVEIGSRFGPWEVQGEPHALKKHRVVLCRNVETGAEAHFRLTGLVAGEHGAYIPKGKTLLEVFAEGDEVAAG